MYVEARPSIRTRSVCDPTLSSWGVGGAESPPSGARCDGLRVYPVCVCNTVRLGQVGQDTT